MLNSIALGEISQNNFLADIKTFINDAVLELKKGHLNINQPLPVEKNQKAVIPTPNTLKCPVCNGNIIEGKIGFGCSNWRPENGNCLFVIWKELDGKKLTEKNIETLLTGMATRASDMDKNGQKFKGKMKLVKDGQNIAIEISPGKKNTTILPYRISCQRPRYAFVPKTRD
jgi:hypothetical protein